MRETFYKDEDINLEVEKSTDSILVHCVITNWKPSVLKQMYKVAGQLVDYKEEHGFKYILTATPNPKFAKLFGGKTVMKIDGNEVIVWG